MGRWIHKGGKSRPDKRFKNVLTPKKAAKPKKKKWFCLYNHRIVQKINKKGIATPQKVLFFTNRGKNGQFTRR